MPGRGSCMKDEMYPYRPALIVQYLGLDGAILAQVADRLLQRWIATLPWEQQHGRPPSDFSFPLGANTADILMQALLLEPGASAAFVALAVEHPEILFGTATDPTLAHRVMLDATDPAHVTATRVQATIVPILKYFEHQRYPLDAGSEGYDDSWPLFLVDLISPWTMQFSGLNHDWNVAAARKVALLAFVIDDDGGSPPVWSPTPGWSGTVPSPPCVPATATRWRSLRPTSVCSPNWC